jgi:hypothetical protein
MKEYCADRPAYKSVADLFEGSKKHYGDFVISVALFAIVMWRTVHLVC